MIKLNKRIGAIYFIIFILLGQFIGIGFVKIDAFPARENTNEILNNKNSNLYSASVEYIIPSVPHYYQATGYWCGPASLEMVYDFYGPDIQQLEIADVARADPSYGCFTDDMRRSTHFSRLSTSVGNEMVGSITGYTNRSIGYGAFEAHLPNVNSLVNLIEDDYPIVVLQHYDLSHAIGHFRVVIGYVESDGNIIQLITHDPWFTDGPNIYFSYATFVDLWSRFSNWALFICPWDITVKCSSLVEVNKTFTVSADVEYVCPLYFSPIYTAFTCKATIQLPPGFSLAPGENPTKNLNPVNLQAGDIGTINWSVDADIFNTEAPISVNASGVVSGSVSAHTGDYIYLGYSYDDLIGGNGSKLVKIVEEIPGDNIIKPIIIMSAIIGSAVVIGVAVILIVRSARRKVSE